MTVENEEKLNASNPKLYIDYGKTIYRNIQEACIYLNVLLLPIFTRSRLLSSIYYCIFSNQFRREHHAALSGKYKYYQNLKSELGCTYLLRRNIHRLEKGLIMRPRKDIFAANYILETVKTYVRLSEVSNEWVDRDQLKWAHDVLLEYFSVVSRHPEIEKARCLFNESKYCTHETIFAPYKRDLSQPISVDYDQFLKLCFRRRSVRWYTEKQVPRELLDQAIAAAALSPSACNRQPFKFRVFDQPVLVQEVASLAGGARGFFHNFPVVIVVVGQLRAYFAEKDRHIIYIDSSLASMTLMFALESLGLSSCSINWPDIDIPEEKMKRLLNLEQDERPIMLISVGYPDPEGMVPYSQKKNLEDIRKYN